MKTFGKSLLSITFGFALVIAFASAAQAQVAKSGTYSAWFGWHSFGTLTDLGKGVMQWHGEFNGALRNDTGSGFMHHASVICPGATLIIGEHAYFRGNCIITDKDGDRATLVWLCDAKLGERCDGPMEWVGGTGKYTGIKGNNTFNGGFVGAGPQGYALWKGEWRLP
jgi:hypothetical protein